MTMLLRYDINHTQCPKPLYATYHTLFTYYMYEYVVVMFRKFCKIMQDGVDSRCLQDIQKFLSSGACRHFGRTEMKAEDTHMYLSLVPLGLLVLCGGWKGVHPFRYVISKRMCVCIPFVDQMCAGSI